MPRLAYSTCTTTCALGAGKCKANANREYIARRIFPECAYVDAGVQMYAVPQHACSSASYADASAGRHQVGRHFAANAMQWCLNGYACNTMRGGVLYAT